MNFSVSITNFVQNNFKYHLHGYILVVSFNTVLLEMNTNIVAEFLIEMRNEN